MHMSLIKPVNKVDQIETTSDLKRVQYPEQLRLQKVFLKQTTAFATLSLNKQTRKKIKNKQVTHLRSCQHQSKSKHIKDMNMTRPSPPLYRYSAKSQHILRKIR